MKQINYKSDFDFILRLRDCRGEEIGWPDYDWEARFWTSTKANSFIAGCTDGEAMNCYNDDGKIHIVADNHHLGRGVLHVEFTAKLPNDLYPDADERIVVPMDLDIELIATAAPCPESFEVELMLSYIKIAWEDLTPEQIAELKKPAVEAAAELRGFVNAAEEAERTRVANETTREEQETARKDAETKRVEAETLRVSAENGRKEAETLRVSAEKKREEDERKRATEFAGYKEAIDAKPDFADLSPVMGERTSEESDEEFEARTGFTREDMKKDLFDDLFRVAAGPYGKVDHSHVEEDGRSTPYYLNELWLTYEEAVDVYEAYVSGGAFSALCRTNIPTHAYYNMPSLSADRFTNTSLEIVVEPGINGWDALGCRILNSHTLREIRDVMLGDVSSNRVFIQSKSLEYIGFKAQNASSKVFAVFDIRNAANFRLDGMAQILRWVKNSTVTVHPDVYAKLTDENNAEWYQILMDAAERNIQFATV